jgi:hypothetical protein
MKRNATLFLQVVIVLIGVGVFAALLWEPHLEGRNSNASLVQIYFNDPFLAYVYLGSIPFFVGLYQAFKVLGYMARNKPFGQATVNALRTIKHCALISAGAIVAADIFLMIAARLHPEVGATDGPEGAVMLGLIATIGCIIVAAAATVLQRVLQNGVEIKSENDLTV